MINLNEYFLNYANCIPVKGHSRCLICDLQNMSFDFITPEMYEILTKHRGKRIADVIDVYGKENLPIIEEYFNFLIEKNYIFFSKTDVSQHFPELNLQWEWQGKIQNAIIDIGDFPHDKSIFRELNKLGCLHFQIRFVGSYFENAYVLEILQTLKNTNINSLHIICPYNAELESIFSDNFFIEYPFINNVTLYGCLEGKFDSYLCEAIYINYVVGQISHLDCGIVHPNYFTTNLSHFTEAQHFNTCLNRKLSIDRNGEIKNCPSFTKSFGNIKNTAIENVIDNLEFQKVWSVKKDDVVKCKDCEFRYVCTDCRAYSDTPDDLNSAPLKCGYDPYACDWEEWSDSCLKERAIKHYGL